MLKENRFIPKAVSEKWTSVKRKTVDIIAAGIAVPSLVMGVQAPPQHDVFNSVARQAIVQTVPVGQDVFVLPVSSPKIITGYERDMEEIQKIQEIFDQTLGIDSTNKKLNYNPVLARWKFEKLQRENADQWKIEKFKRYETFQIETVLRERNKAAKSVVKYSIDKEGNVWNDRFPDEPFSAVLERGLIYQKEHDSREIIREQSEYDGWVDICNFLKYKNTPLHTKVLVFSGPGVAEETNYPDNFADWYEKMEDPDTHEIYIRMIRNAIELTYPQTAAIALQKDVHYFDHFEGPVDAWHLRHGIVYNPHIDLRTIDEIMDQDIGRRKGAMHEDLFQKVFKPSADRITYYIQELCNNNFNPKNLAIAYNSILEMNDRVKQALTEKDDIKYWEAVWNEEFARFRNVQDQVDWYGRQYIAPVAAACGMSSAFTIEDSLGLSNSVAKFGIQKLVPGEERTLECYCPKCDPDKVKGKVKAKISNGEITCPRCDESASYEC